MIKTFADKRTRDLYENGKSKRFPPDMWERALRKLEYLDLATSVADLKILPSNRLHKLERDRMGQHSISINNQWRICFRFKKRRCVRCGDYRLSLSEVANESPQ